MPLDAFLDPNASVIDCYYTQTYRVAAKRTRQSQSNIIRCLIQSIAVLLYIILHINVRSGGNQIR